MRESFTEYKKTLEHNLIKIGFLYSGDIISSNFSQYTEIKNSPLTSPSFIINSISDIYSKSFEKMVDKSREFIIPEESIKDDVFSKISELGIKTSYVFCSEKGRNFLGIHKWSNNISALPNYFYSIDKNISNGIEVFYSPLILDEEDEIILYITDAPIQSLVYSIQNMDYSIDSTIDGFKPNIPDRWVHKLEYNLYDCNFNSYKLSIRNVSRLRQDKINKILNDN